MVSPPILKKEVEDGGWGWVVVFSSFMISLICDGFAYTTGIFYSHFLGVYNKSEAITSMFDAVMTGLLFAMGPLASGLTSVYGCRNVSMFGSMLAVVGMLSSIILDNIYTHVLTLGVLTGTGLGLIYLPQVVIVTHWFNKHLSLAIGISVCGTGFGIAIFAVLGENLILMFGWKGAMLLMSGLMFTNIFFSSMFRPGNVTQQNLTLLNALKETLNFKILKEVLFLYYGFANFLNGTVYYVPVIFLRDHMIKTGLGDSTDAVKIMVFLGLSNAFGRALFGYISEYDCINRIYIFSTSVIFYGTTIFLLATAAHLYRNLTYLFFGTIFFGIAEGAFVCLSSVVMVDLFGVKKVANVFGITNLILGVASFIGPPLIAKTVDPKTGYMTGFYISSALTVMSGILFFFLPVVQRKYKISDE